MARLTELFKVTYAGKMRFFRFENAARAFARRHPGATVKKVAKLPEEESFKEANMAPAGHAYFVRWANGKGITYWDSLDAAQIFSDLHEGDASEPKLDVLPKQRRLRRMADVLTLEQERDLSETIKAEQEEKKAAEKPKA